MLQAGRTGCHPTATDIECERVRRIKNRLRTLLCCGILEAAVMFGIPMRAGQIEELMRSLNVPTLAHTIPDERPDGRRATIPDPPEAD
jgi:hypothetical protein